MFRCLDLIYVLDITFFLSFVSELKKFRFLATTALRTTPGPIVSTTGSVDFRAQLPPAAPTSGNVFVLSGFDY